MTGLADRAGLLDEGLDIIDALWRGERHAGGERYEVDVVPGHVLDLRPVQQPRVPIWVVGAWPRTKSMRRVLRCDGIMPVWAGADRRPLAPADVTDLSAWLTERGRRRYDIVIEGATPADNIDNGRATVAAWAAAGASWWLEARWDLPHHSPERMRQVRDRIGAGPPPRSVARPDTDDHPPDSPTSRHPRRNRCVPPALALSLAKRVNARMAWFSLGLSALWVALGLGVRTWLHRRRTGRSPLRRGAGPRWWIAVIGVHSTFLAAPVAELGFGAKRLVHSTWLGDAGGAVAVGAVAVMLWSQSSMGESLRIGVDPTERTTLVTAGPFRWVRNPIYSAMVAYVVGTAMMVPNPAGIVAAVALVVGEQVQVRRVEEPYLTAIHGTQFRSYAAHVGRFLPRIGRMTEGVAPRKVREPGIHDGRNA